MSRPCATPVPVDRLLDYLLGELPAGHEDRLEEHLFGCAPCAAEAEKLAGLFVAIGRAVAPVLSRAHFEALEAAGAVAEVSVMTPGGVAEVFFPPTGKLLVLRLEGAEIGEAQRIDVAVRTPAGTSIGRFDDVPFDASRGEVLLACQRHFAETYPRDLVFGLEVVSGDERRRVAEYTVLHRLA